MKILLLCINYSTYQTYNMSMVLKSRRCWLKVQNFPLQNDNGEKKSLKNTELVWRPFMHSIVFFVLSDWQVWGLASHLECICSHIFTAMWLQKITNICNVLLYSKTWSNLPLIQTSFLRYKDDTCLIMIRFISSECLNWLN